MVYTNDKIKTEDYMNKKEAEDLGILGYLNQKKSDVVKLEQLRKLMGITPHSLEEQKRERAAFEKYKQSPDYQIAIGGWDK